MLKIREWGAIILLSVVISVVVSAAVQFVIMTNAR